MDRRFLLTVPVLFCFVQTCFSASRPLHPPLFIMSWGGRRETDKRPDVGQWIRPKRLGRRLQTFLLPDGLALAAWDKLHDSRYLPLISADYGYLSTCKENTEREGEMSSPDASLFGIVHFPFEDFLASLRGWDWVLPLVFAIACWPVVDKRTCFVWAYGFQKYEESPLFPTADDPRGWAGPPGFSLCQGPTTRAYPDRPGGTPACLRGRCRRLFLFLIVNVEPWSRIVFERKTASAWSMIELSICCIDWSFYVGASAFSPWARRLLCR